METSKSVCLMKHNEFVLLEKGLFVGGLMSHSESRLIFLSQSHPA